MTGSSNEFWRMNYPGMLQCVLGYIVNDVASGHCIFHLQGHHASLKSRQIGSDIVRHPRKTLIFSISAGRTLNLGK